MPQPVPSSSLVPQSPHRPQSHDLRGAGLHGKMIANEEIVDPGAENAADAGRHDRYPPPPVAGTEHLAAPAGDRREQARTEIARRVDRVAGVETERGADQDDEEADDDRRKTGGRR